MSNVFRGWASIAVVLVGVLSCDAGAAFSATAWTATPDSQVWSKTLQRQPPLTLQMQMRLTGSDKPVQIALHAGRDGTAPGILRVTIRRDSEGRELDVRPATFAETWQPGERVKLRYWPPERDQTALARAAEDGLTPRTWVDRPVPVRWELQQHRVLLWVQGKLVGSMDAEVSGELSLHVTASPGDAIDSISTEAAAGGWRYQPIDLSPIVNETLASPVAVAQPGDNDAPFVLAADGKEWLNLRNAKWIDSVRNPSSYYERYDSGQYFLGDDRMPMIQVPRCDYVAAHVLAVADGDEQWTDRLTLRVGRYNQGYTGQVLRYDFSGRVPRGSHGQGLAGELREVRLPMTQAFAQDVVGEVMDVELTKELRLVRRTPDPNRFRWRPIGRPSGVRIAAITFERSPLQMKVTSAQSGHLFVQPLQPTFTVSLQNITPEAQPYTLSGVARHLHGSQVHAAARGQVPPGETVLVELPIEAQRRGYYDLSIQLAGRRDALLLERQTSFAVLPQAERPHHAQSPVGVWDFSGRHWTPKDPDFVGPLYRKLGIRFGMFHHRVEDRQKYGVVKGNEASMRSGTKIDALLDAYQKRAEEHPDQLKSFLLFHEDSISGRHVTRVPDLFHDRPPYQLDEEEQKRFDHMFLLAKTAAEQMRAYDPSVRISIGNGPLPLREEFYRAGFPAELFDAAGNEAGVFGRMPERQPPDIVANNASIWMDRQLLDHYGYQDKGVVQCYEITYPSTNPGNLSYGTQAAYFVRHILHGMAWRIPEIRVGSLTDMGNSYYFSNWGSSGIFHKLPEVNPKPSAVALGTLTWVLDGATFEREIDLGSDSLFGLAFLRPDGKRVVALWTIRGERRLTFALDDVHGATLIDSQANETPLEIAGDQVALSVNGTPRYLVLDGDVHSATAGEPRYRAAPAAHTTGLDSLANLDDWTIAGERNHELEFYNPFEPRRKGDF
ncbi:MAG: hypothetical protein ACF788_03305, partial [Novipirellula sp. JB048]